MAKLDCHVYGIPASNNGHAHPYAHILLPISGEMSLVLDSKTLYLTPWHLGFVAPGRYHHCISDSEIILINIPESMIHQSDLEALSNQSCLKLTGELELLVGLIKAEVCRNPDGDSVRYLYYYLYDRLVDTSGTKSIRYIREHFGEEISIAKLAALENYTSSYFTDWFKRQTGYSPTGYLRQVRIEKAKELLAVTRYRLVDVALQVGFSGNPAFTRAFKELEGIPPAEYRRRYHRNSDGFVNRAGQGE